MGRPPLAPREGNGREFLLPEGDRGERVRSVLARWMGAGEERRRIHAFPKHNAMVGIRMPQGLGFCVEGKNQAHGIVHGSTQGK